MDYILGRNKQPVNPDIESEKIDVVKYNAKELPSSLRD